MAGTRVHNLSLESSPCFCAAFSGFHVWLIRTIEFLNYTKELKYFVSSLISWYYEWWDIATALRSMPKHAGRRGGMGYRTKGEITSCKSLWSVRRSICLLRLSLNLFLKCIKCLSVTFSPDSICDSLWRYPEHRFPDAVCIHMRRVWSKDPGRLDHVELK